MQPGASKNQNYPKPLRSFKHRNQGVRHCRRERWHCTHRLALTFTLFTPLLQIRCSFLQVYWPPSPLTSVTAAPHEYRLQAVQRTATALTFLKSSFSWTTPDLGLSKENSFPIFPQASCFLLNCRSWSNKTISFWLIYYLARSSSLQFYLLLYLVCFSTEVFCLLLQCSPR